MNQHTGDAWSDEETATARKLFDDGHGPKAIADVIGKTRNAVVGKLNRLGLRMGEEARAQAYARGARIATMKLKAAKPKPEKKNNNPCGWGAIDRAEKPKCVKDGKRASPNLPQLNVVPTKSIEDLGSRHCRAIGERPELLTLDTLVYCGKGTDGGSWCPEHKAQVFRPLRNSGGG